MVKISIEDVTLMKEVRHFVRQNGWYDEFQLNPRLFQCRLDCFLLLCSKLDGEIVFTEANKQKLRELEANEDERSAIEKILDHDFEDGFKELVTQSAEDVLCKVLEQLPFGKFGSNIVSSVFAWMKKRKSV